MTENDHYASAWRSLGRRRWAALFALVSYLPAMMILSGIFPNAGAKLFFGWAAFLMLPAGIALSAVRCPRCGKFFTWGWQFSNPLAGKCVHCGLRSGTSPEPRLI